MRLVFVHLGPSKAPHLTRNIQRLSTLFPDLRITVIVSTISSLEIRDNPSIAIFQYKNTNEVNERLERLLYNPKFRSGFWRYSLERIFALEQYHYTCKDEKLLHLESDCLVLPNFPFGKFAEFEKLAWTRDTDIADVATILFLPNYNESSWLAKEVTELLFDNFELTDMTALNTIARANTERVHLLPSKSEEIYQGNSYWDGIFDPAGYGVWLTGQDPRNNFGFVIRGKIGSNTLVKPSCFDYTFIANGELLLKDELGTIPLYNLHIHSKNLLLFSNFWKTTLRFEIYKSKNDIKLTYSWKAAIYIIRDLHARHGIHKMGFYAAIYRLLRQRYRTKT